mmetsp:Transcript_23205/g.35846  ORF Transcript_23205/g.35846 Transcript_23205/m.35846 type:complete len:81 (+) Transcript_23205:376-618(+)
MACDAYESMNCRTLFDAAKMSFKAFESSDRMKQTKKSNRIVIKNYTFEDYPQHNKPNLSKVGIPIHAQISAHMHPCNKKR